MNQLFFILADAQLPMSTGLRYALIIVAALVVVLPLSFAAAMLLGRKTHRHKHHKSRPAVSPPDGVEPRRSSRSEGRSRRRRRRSEHPERPAGIPLAQTGGLPPVRKDETPPRGL